MTDEPIHLAERAAQLLRDGKLQGLAGLMPPRPLVTVPGTTVPGAVVSGNPVPGATLPVWEERPPAAPAQEPAPLPAERVGRAVLQLAGLAGSLEGRSQVAQELSVLQSALLGHCTDLDAPGIGTIVMVTSARAGEGKSFVALNLAASLAHNGSREVLLVDADSKPNNLSHRLGLSDRPGLLDLAPERDPRAAALKLATAVDRLSMLPAGRSAPGEGALHGVVAAGSLVAALRANYPGRIVVMDTPPCLATSEPATLAPLVQHTVLVVQAEKTSHGEVTSSLDLLRGCPNIMLMLNKAQLPPATSFGGYYT